MDVKQKNRAYDVQNDRCEQSVLWPKLRRKEYEEEIAKFYCELAGVTVSRSD